MVLGWAENLGGGASGEVSFIPSITAFDITLPVSGTHVDFGTRANDVTGVHFSAAGVGYTYDFRADYSGIGTDDNGEYFGVAEFTLLNPPPNSCPNTTAPSSAVVDGKMVMTFVNSSGLANVIGMVMNNCSLSGTAYDASNNVLSPNPVGAITLTDRANLPVGTAKLVVTATKIDAGAPATVNVLTKDVCDRGVSFDPIITTVEVLSGNEVEQHFEGLLAPEQFLLVQNGTPGLERLKINLNGHSFAVNLTAGQTVASDLGSAMLEGDQNVVTLTGHGAAGSSAFVTLTDTPTGSEMPLQEVTQLSVSRSAAGLKLSWPEALAGWKLQSSPSPSAGWTDVTNPPVALNGEWTVTVEPTVVTQLYRITNPTDPVQPTAKIKTAAAAHNPATPAHDSILW